MKKEQQSAFIQKWNVVQGDDVSSEPDYSRVYRQAARERKIRRTALTLISVPVLWFTMQYVLRIAGNVQL